MMKDSGIEWVGSIPDKWDVIPAGGLFTEIKEKNKNLKYTNPLQFRFGTIVDKAYTGDLDESLLETLRTYTCVEPDTIMLNGLNLNYDFISQRVGIVTKPGVITSAYLAVYPDKKRILPRYANYLLKAYDSIFVFHGMGSGVRKTLQWKDFKNLKFVLPSIEEQATIIKALDSLCAKTDTLIANVQTQIEKLKAYKQSVITEVVTKGLDPTVLMKDSGVEWIGEIPEHWNVAKARRIITSTQNGMTRRDLTESKGQIVLKLKNISADGSIDYSCINRIALSEKEEETYALQDGDFLFVRVNGSKGLVGKCAIFEDNGEITAYNDHIIRVRINTFCCKEYFHYYLLSGAGKTEIEHHTSTSAGQYTISGEGLRDIWLVLPPKDIQENLCSFLDEKCSKIDRLIALKQEKIEKLELYNRSLIYEYVTGKRDVM